jgi:glucosamine--fructose-6-phosphate aminotransferase (isomerizing)
MQEVRARGGKIVLISDAKGIEQAGEGTMATIEMPEVHPLIAPLVYAVPVIVIAPSGPLFEKTVSNMQEVRARGGKIVLISDSKGIAEAGEGCMATIEMPEVHPLIAPLVYAVPVQLLAYHTAVLKGTDVDQPRNLAKSVTVE